MKKRILSMLLAIVMVVGMFPAPTLAAQDENAAAVTLPKNLYIGGVAVVANGVVGSVTSGTGWSYDTATAILYLTDGADIRYTNESDTYLKCGIYCDGVLNVHASGKIDITGYGCGIYLPGGDLYLHAEEGAAVNVSSIGDKSTGIYSTSDVVSLSGKGTVNASGIHYGIYAGTVNIDGVTLNAQASTYADIDGGDVYVGQTEAAVVNCLGSTCGGIGGGGTVNIGIYNGSTVHVAEKARNSGWLTGLTSTNIAIADSHVVIDGLTGTYHILAIHGNTTVSGNSHILIRGITATDSGGAYGVTTEDTKTLTVSGDYYFRQDLNAELIKNQTIKLLYVSQFELCTASHVGYCSNGDGTHYFGCFAPCPAAIKGENETCSGETTCTEKAFCEICNTEHGPDPVGHIPDETTSYTDNGDGTHSFTCSVCGAASEAHDFTDGGTCVCSAICPHSGFDSATGICADCEISVAIAKIETGGTTSYYQTADALQAAMDANFSNRVDQTVTLLADFEMSKFAFRAFGTKNTLDLNGHNITGKVDSILIVANNCEVTVTGTGSLENPVIMSVANENSKIIVGSGVTMNGELYNSRGGVFDLSAATIPAAGLSVKLQPGDNTYNVSDILLLPEDYYFFVDGVAVHSYSETTDGKVLKHTEHSYTYTDNGDGTHDKTCTDCGTVAVDNQGHIPGEAGCTVNEDGTHSFTCSLCGTDVNEAHSTTAAGDSAADCNSRAYCSVCESYYGEVDKTRHDSSVAYDDNGFCPICDAYEPATDSDSDGVYEISNAGQLYWFAQQVNSGNASINGKLMANIVVNEGTMSAETTDARPWTPIGNSSTYYTGTFNGADYTISGLYFNDGTVDSVGLFGAIGNGAAVQNVSLAASYIYGQNHAGGIVGYNYKGTVSGCTNSSKILGSEYNTGGVVGSNYGTVSNCTNSGDVSSSSNYVGGVVGSNYDTVSNCTNSGDVSGSGSSDCVGGVVGYNSSGSVTGCTNSSDVLGSCRVGGVVGESSSSGTVSNCRNTGTVVAIYTGISYAGGVVGYNSGTITNCYNAGTVGSSGSHVGGIVGYNSSGTISNCYNTGKVIGPGGRVGGIVGYNSNGTISNCYNTGTVSSTGTGGLIGGIVGYNYNGTISNCYNTGTVSSTGYYVGGVVGYGSGGEISNCYNTGKVTGTDRFAGGVAGSNTGSINNCYYLDTAASGGMDGADAVGQAEAKTSEQFASGEVAYLLNGDQSTIVFKQTIGTDDTPNFTGATVYAIQNCKSETLYSNTNENIGHQWENGKCTVCGETCSHTGGEASCTAQAVCDICGASYGELRAHSTTAEGDKPATCASSAYCSVCESYYGEVDKTKHDSSVAFDSNGFCPNGCYEPATDSDSDGVYEISNAGQLYWFAQQVNSGNTSINGKLMTNIVVNEGTMSAETTGARAWIPIGNSSNMYTGTFNGAGFTISGLYFNDKTAGDVGLFGFVGNGATIQNVTLAASYLSGKNNVGGIVGLNYNGTVSGCTNSSEIVGSERYTGGVAGRNYGVVSNCTNSGNVSSSYYVGGVVGYTSSGSVTGCTNSGDVSGGYDAGGIVGWSYSGSVSGCANSGKVSGSYDVGGVLGANSGSGTVSNCFNTGTVNATSNYAGGVVGHNSGTVSNCYNIGSVSGYACIGGVAGTNTSVVTNCYYLNGCATDGSSTVQFGIGSGSIGSTMADIADQTAGKFSAQFASGEVAYLLNGDQSIIVFKQTIGTDDYPNFTGATVYAIQNCKSETLYSNTNENIGHQWENGVCTVCDETCSHTGGTATCTTLAVCDICGESYGELGGHTPADNAIYTDNGNGTHSYTCSVCSTDVTEAHSFGTGNSCVCGAEVAFTGIEITSSFATIDKGSGSYIAVIEPGKEGTDISYKYVGNNLECLTAANTLLKTRRANSVFGEYTPLLKEMIAMGFTGTVLNWKDGTWWEWDYSNDGGITWEGVHIDVKQGYTITNSTADDADGTIALPEYSVSGETVSVTVSPAAGYVLNALTVTDDAGGSVTVNNNSFTMPAGNVTVTATFKIDSGSIVFYANNGTDQTYILNKSSTWTLPTAEECGFTAPEGKVLMGWALDSVNGNMKMVGQQRQYAVSGGRALYAIWTDPVASVTIGGTTTYYSNLIDAFTAADGKTAEIKLLTDWNNSAFAEHPQIKSNSSRVTFDLNGHKIFNSNSSESNALEFAGVCVIKNGEIEFTGGGQYIVFYSNAKNSTLTIGSNTKISNLNPYGNAVLVSSGGNTLIVEAGAEIAAPNKDSSEKTGAICLYANATLIVNGGTISSSGRNDTDIAAYNTNATNTTVVVNGGDFDTVKADNVYFNVNHTATVTANVTGNAWYKLTNGIPADLASIGYTANTTVYEGSTYGLGGAEVSLTAAPAIGKKVAKILANDTEATLSQGVYSFTMPGELVTLSADIVDCDHSDGTATRTPTQDEEQHIATYDCCGAVVTEDHSMDAATGECACGVFMAVAKVSSGDTTTYYADIAAALSAAQASSGSTLTLLDNIFTDVGTRVESGTFTIDLGGKTWESSEVVLYIGGSTTDITIIDPSGAGKLLGSGANTTLKLYGSAKLEIAGGTVENSNQIEAVSLEYSGHTTEAELIISGGKLITNGDYAIGAFGSSVTVTGGILESSAVDIYHKTGITDLSAHSDPSGITVFSGSDTEAAVILPAGYAWLDEYGNVEATLAADKICTVVKVYTVTVSTIANGKVEADKAIAIEGETVKLTATADTGYLFDSWTLIAADGKPVTVEDDSFTMPASNVTVSASFVACGHENAEYTDNGDGTHTMNCAACGATVTEPHDFENDAHKCACEKVETFTVYWALAEFLGLENGTSTFGQEFVHTFTVPENTHLRIEDVYLRSDPSTHISYTYENGVLTIAAADIPAGDIEVLCNHYVEVKFDANGGVIKPEDSYPEEGDTGFAEDGSYWIQEFYVGGDVFLHNYADVTRTGYTLVDWRDANGMIYPMSKANGAIFVSATEDVTVYAQWQCNHTIGGVDFRDNGDGTHNGHCGECGELLGNYLERPHVYDETSHECACGAIETFKLYVEGQTLAVAYGGDLAQAVSGITSAKTGYNFTGWAYYWLNENGAEIPYTDSTMPAMELYAKPVFEAILYNITWDMAGCSYSVNNYDELPTKLAYNVDSDDHNINFVEITAPEGYEFVRFEDGDGNALRYIYLDHYRLFLTVSGDMTVKAVIQPRSYMATWTDGDGASYEKEFKYGETITIPTSVYFLETFRKTGYTLTGWEGYTEGMTMPIDGVTFTAIYQVNEYTITFDSDGGSAVAPITQDFGTAITAPEAPVKDGYHFAGWDALPETMPAKNITVKALWEEHKDYSYSASGDTITAICGICSEVLGTATISAEDGVYDGSAKETAAVSYSEGWVGGELTVSYANNVNAGTATASISIGGVTASIDFTIAKAIPRYELPTGLTATYGDTLADVELPEGFTWQDDVSTSVGSAGTSTFKVSYTPADTANYEIVTDIEVTVSVAKAAPGYTAPTALEGLVYTGLAQTLANAGSSDHGTMVYSLSENGEYSETVPTGTNAGEYKVYYKLLGDENHTDSQPEYITVTIAKADPIVTAPIPAEGLVFNGEMQILVASNGSTTGGTLVCYADGRDNWAMGYSAGTYVIEYYVAGDSNYNDVPPASISVTIAPLNLAGIEYDIRLSEDSFVYDASAKTPAVEVLVILPGNDIPLEATLSDEDCTVSYSDNIGPGTATVTIEGKGNYTGSITKTFEIVCDHSLNDNEIHTDNGDGTHSLICSVCSEAALTHAHSFGTKASDRMAAPADCDDAALYYVLCDHCDAVSSTETVAVGSALGHNYEAVVTAPTCTEDGYTTYTCSVCGDTYVADEVPALGHDYVAVVTEPTCTEDGYTTYTCSVCGDTYVADEVAALGHDYEAVVTAPTCTEDGYTTYTCSVCGDTYVADEVPALGHDYVAVVTEPTCTEDGYTTYTCSVCGDTYVADQVPALGHDYVAVVTEPTCTEDGYTTYTCSVCGDSYVADEVAALGHDYVAVVTEPTCTEDGYTTYTCSVCGDTYVADEVPALGHDYEAVVTEPTCTEGGYTTYTCSVCGDSYVADEVPALGHSEEIVPGYEPSCTEPGLTDGTKCSVCGETLVEQEEIPAHGHVYDNICDLICNICGYERDIPTVPMFRMYDPNSGEHFYTGSEEERDILIGAGWNYEGVAFNFPVIGDPVYRLYNTVTGDHLYTMDMKERAQLLARGWRDEGVAFNSATSDCVPQYRLWNPNAVRGAWHFTGSERERDYLISLGWQYQGIGWYSMEK